jgi:HEAT repeat protein
VRLFPGTTARNAVAAPGGGTRIHHDDVTILLQGLHDPDPAVRAASIEALGRSGHEVPVDHVLAVGLGDHDPRGRLAALTSGLPVTGDVLVDRAINDASPMVRAEALAQLPRNDPRVEAVARAALADQDVGVRDVAQAVLATLNGIQDPQ